jgi:hypothetical protein
MHNECDLLMTGISVVMLDDADTVREWDSLFKSGHCRSLLTKVRQRACNAPNNSPVKLVSARRDSAVDPRNLGRSVTVLSGCQVLDRAHHR